MRFPFKVKRTLDELNNAKRYLDYLFANDKNVLITVERGLRTQSQNAYLHVIFGLIAVETGYTLEEIKQLFKNEYLTYNKNGKTFIKSTSNLNTKEATTFIEQIRNYCNIELGIYIPEPYEKEKLEALRDDLKRYYEFIGNKDKYE